MRPDQDWPESSQVGRSSSPSRRPIADIGGAELGFRMNASEYASLWQNLRSILGKVLELERGRIGQQQACFVEEFIDHNEFGLAHDQLKDALSDLGLAPLERSNDLLSEAAELMHTGQ